MCFIEYEFQGTTCQIKVHTKIRPEPITCILEDINPYKTDIDQVISRLTLTLVPVSENLVYENVLKERDGSNKDELRFQNEAIRFDSHLIAAVLPSESSAWIDEFEEGLFYKVPKHLISYVEGAKPSKLQ